MFLEAYKAYMTSPVIYIHKKFLTADLLLLICYTYPMLKLLILLAIIYGVFKILKIIFRKRLPRSSLPIEKKPFVFDAMTEFTMYRMLIEVFSENYHVFPQMSYGRIIKVKDGADPWLRNYFDKKIADFVLCDKERGVVQVVIELDGGSHKSLNKKNRDEDINTWMEQIAVPILHLSPTYMDKEYIKLLVATALQKK